MSKQTPMLYQGPFGNQWYLATRYKDLGDGKFEALTRIDVTASIKPLLEANEQVKQHVLHIIGDDEESRYAQGEATYGDTLFDSASVYFGRNELREELRRQLEKL